MVVVVVPRFIVSNISIGDDVTFEAAATAVALTPLTFVHHTNSTGFRLYGNGQNVNKKKTAKNAFKIDAAATTCVSMCVYTRRASMSILCLLRIVIGTLNKMR